LTILSSHLKNSIAVIHNLLLILNPPRKADSLRAYP
jgi:hypothetical protein